MPSRPNMFLHGLLIEPVYTRIGYKIGKSKVYLTWLHIEKRYSVLVVFADSVR